MWSRDTVERRKLDEGRTTDLMDMLAPSVEHARRELFDSSGRPFTNADQAAAWIQEQAAKENPPPVDPELQAQLLEVAARVKELRGRTGLRLHLRLESPVPLRYGRPDQPDTVRVLPDSPLDRLAAAARAMADATGWPEEVMVALVLHGEEPRHPLFRVEQRWIPATLPDGTKPERYEAAVRIFDPRIPPARWRQLRETLAREWGEVYSGLDDMDRAIIEIVRELGGPDRKHPWSLKFWGEVAQKLRQDDVRHYRDGMYSDGHGPLNRARRRPALRRALGLPERLLRER